MAIKEALSKKRPGTPSILEARYRRQSLALAPGVCLVDTPGMAQMLLGSEAGQASVVTGPENTYVRVEQVWEKWRSRADVVRWCLPADKPNGTPETAKHLATLVHRYGKLIIPVLTKADDIDGRFDEAAAKFTNRYAHLLNGSPPFLMTYAGGRENVTDTGINALRSHLQKYASQAKKLHSPFRYSVSPAGG